MYYLIKTNGVVEIKEVLNSTDGTYHELKRNGYNVIGVFGGLLYAELWRDFENKVITIDELNKALDKF